VAGRLFSQAEFLPRPLSFRSILSPLASPLLLSLSHVAGSLPPILPHYCGLPALQPFVFECAVNNALSGVREDRAYLPDLAATVSTLRTPRPP
jgi:hypothetical protein